MERYLAYNRSYKRQKRVMDRMRELQMAGITHGDIATLLLARFRVAGDLGAGPVHAGVLAV
jgi:hypothetical protein